MGKRIIKDFNGKPVELVESRLGGDVSVTLGWLYRYDRSGEERVEFCRGKNSRDWYIWSVLRQHRIASYRTRAALEEAWREWH